MNGSFPGGAVVAAAAAKTGTQYICYNTSIDTLVKKHLLSICLVDRFSKKLKTNNLILY